MANIPWSRSDVAKLERLAAAGLGFPQLSQEFAGRTIKAIREFCRRHEIDVKVETEATEMGKPIHPSRLPNYEGMSFTGLLMGDPPIGRRAIDQRNRGQEA